MITLPILTMESRKCPRGGRPDHPAEWALLMTWPEGFDPPDLPALDNVAPSPILQPYVNHGRWLIGCPWCDNVGAYQYASVVDRLFLCHVCFNATVQGRWVRLRWPAQWKEIEEALLPRPIEARTWWDGISVQQLLAENASHL